MAALLAVVFFGMVAGAGSASASTTAVCETNSSPSPCTHLYGTNARFEVVGTATFEGLTTCAFTYEYELGNNRATSPLQAKMRKWEFVGCSGGHTVATLGLPAPFWITTTGTGPNGIGEFEPRSHHPFEVDGSCVYEATTIPQSIAGGGYITSSGVALHRITGSCPSVLSMSTTGKPIPMFWLTN